MSFGNKDYNPLPPFNFLHASYETTSDLDKNGRQIITKSVTLKMIKEYAGKDKGLAQVLWERGLYIPN